MSSPDDPDAHGSPALVLREATRSDAAAIAAIYNESIAAADCTMDEEPWSADRMADALGRLAPPLGCLVIAGAAVVGWGQLKPYSDRPGYRFAAEVSIFLRRDQRGRGHGRRLLEALLERADAGGLHHLVAKIQHHNRGSLALFERAGFEVVGVQREIGLQGGRWIDVAILQRIAPARAVDQWTTDS